MTRELIAACALCLVAQTNAAAELIIKSSEAQVGLLELYTSEGCSSCPPADRWLSDLKNHAGLWTRFVPVGLHVDYWDYIGWQDRFASPKFSQRQRDYARQNYVSTVYTPGFIYNGREWRNWLRRSSSRFPGGGKPGVLALFINDRRINVRFVPTEARLHDLETSVALLGFGISTDVKAGENSGRELRHDFVVLTLEHNRLNHSDGTHDTVLQLPASHIEAERYAVAAWVSETGSPAPLQAVGGWLPVGM